MTGRIYIYCAICKFSWYFRWNRISFVELVTAVPDPDFEIRGSVNPAPLLDRGACSQKTFFWPFGPEFSVKIRGGRAPRAPPLYPTLHSSMRINASYLLNAHSWTPKIEYKLPLHLDHLRYICSRGGGTPLFCLYGYVPLNRVWFSGSWVLNRVYNFTI